jgi:putative ABC transport system permease protein
MSDWSALLRDRLDALRLHPGRAAEIVEELGQHLEERYAELRAQGVVEGDARRLAVAELDPDMLAAWMRPLRQANLPPPITPADPHASRLGGVAQDVRYAWRMLRKEPGLTAAALLTLALGIGANGAIFALADAVLLRPLPFPSPERLAALRETTTESASEGVSPLNLADWRDRSRSFEAIGGYLPNVGSMVLGEPGGAPETVSRQWVTEGIFRALGVTPVAGRTFLPEDDAGDLRRVILSESFWRSRFDGDPKIVGRDLRLDGEGWTVVGVVPDEARIIGRSHIWAVTSIRDLPPRARGAHFLSVIGRVEPGVSLAAATAELQSVAAQLTREFPETNAGRSVAVESLREAVIGSELRETSILLFGVVGLVLLICCANLANLLMTRATKRRREFALRAALGARRGRLVRQLLVESLLLAAIGGAAGAALGMLFLKVAPSLLPEDIVPAALTLSFDLRVGLFCAAAALLVGCFFGLAPAWQARELSLAGALTGGARVVTARGGRLRAALVAGQVATAVILLVCAGLLLRTLFAVMGVERGYGADSVLTMLVDPHGSVHPDDASLLRFYRTVAEELEALPGVHAATWATTLPLGDSYEGSVPYAIAGATPVEASQRPTADYQIVDVGYFAALDLPLVEGRAFNERDGAESVPVAIVNEAFARRHFAGRSPVGERVGLFDSDGGTQPTVEREIVGVARQVKGDPTETEDLLQVYVPLAQDTVGDAYLLIRSDAGRPEELEKTAQRVIARHDKEQLVGVREAMTLDGVVAEASARHRFRAILVASFAALALLLAMVGVFGVLAYSVQQRMRDFGVRRALGATTGDVLRLAAGGATRLVATGALVGLAVSLLAGRLLVSMLFGVAPLDLATFAGVAGVVLITAALSVAGPVRRATRVDPAVTLRDE